MEASFSLIRQSGSHPGWCLLPCSYSVALLSSNCHFPPCHPAERREREHGRGAGWEWTPPLKQRVSLVLIFHWLKLSPVVTSHCKEVWEMESMREWLSADSFWHIRGVPEGGLEKSADWPTLFGLLSILLTEISHRGAVQMCLSFTNHLQVPAYNLSITFHCI